MLGVVGRLAIYFGGLVSAIMLANLAGMLNWMMMGTAIVSTRLYTWLGIAAMRSGTQIYLHSRTLSIDLACTAIFIMALYVALVLAYPVSARHRFLGLAIGIPSIVFANFVRLVAVAEVSESIQPAFAFLHDRWFHTLPLSAPAYSSTFTFFHDYLFQVGMVLVTVVALAAWLSYVRKDA